MILPGQYTVNRSEISSQQKPVLIYTPESNGASRVKSLAQEGNSVHSDPVHTTSFSNENGIVLFRQVFKKI